MISLLDTRPKLSAADTLAALKRYWRHDNLGDNVDWRIDASQLQILPSVSSDIKKSFVTFLGLLELFQTVTLSIIISLTLLLYVIR